MRYFLFLFVFVCVLSCKEEFKRSSEISKVEIKTLLADSLLNVRAITIANNKLWFAGFNGNIGNESLDLNNLTRSNVFKSNDDFANKLSTWTRIFKNDSTTLPIRSIAKINDAFFVLSIESPAMLYKFEDGNIDLVYQENHPKAFYDSIDFWNDNEGIAMGDPTDDCISIIITRDGGETWNKLSCDVAPKAIEGEAAFAASDTNIAIVGDETWIATGGMVSRILYSPDKGKTWEVFETPIIQGKSTTGMYSLDFYDAINGFAIGGDYTDADGNIGNKIRTNDGGKTWQLVADGENPGYRSCVQYVPNSDARELVAVGFKGVDYSTDAGKTWSHISDDSFYTIRFANDSTAYAGGNGVISKLTFK